MKRFESLGRSLSKAEQMQIKGGYVQQVYQCSCIGGPGTWHYTDAPSDAQRIADINEYCQHNANCGWATCGNPGVIC